MLANGGYPKEKLLNVMDRCTELCLLRLSHPTQASIFGASFGLRLTVSGLTPLSSLYSRLWTETTLKNVVWKTPGLPTASRIKCFPCWAATSPSPSLLHPWPSPSWMALCPERRVHFHALLLLLALASPSPCGGLILPSFSAGKWLYSKAQVGCHRLSRSLPAPLK